MKVLVVAATREEILPSLPFLEKHKIAHLITGVGMTATAFSLGTHLAKEQYDLLIHVGIAGSFSRNIQIGDIVRVVQDEIFELGAEDQEDFLPIEKLGFGDSRYFEKTTPSIESKLSLIKVSGITVNKVHGRNCSIQPLLDNFGNNPVVESMEGATVFYAAQQYSTPCIQVRTISNYVEPRNRANWNIAAAVKNLNSWLETFLSH